MKDINEIETWFKNAPIPETIQLNRHTKILNVKKFIASHLETVKANPDNKTYAPYLERLKELKNRLQNAQIR